MSFEGFCLNPYRKRLVCAVHAVLSCIAHTAAIRPIAVHFPGRLLLFLQDHYSIRRQRERALHGFSGQEIQIPGIPGFHLFSLF